MVVVEVAASDGRSDNWTLVVIRVMVSGSQNDGWSID